MSLAPFDVVVVPFPYSDALGEKRRPALVVSSADVEAEHGWVWLAMITSTPGLLRLGDVAIADPAAAGLNRLCRVRTAKIATLDVRRILRRVGALTAADRTAVLGAIAMCVGV